MKENALRWMEKFLLKIQFMTKAECENLKAFLCELRGVEERTK